MCFRNRRKLDTDGGGTVLQRTERFIIPACDTRSYRGLVLANKLKVVLISDPTAIESFASLCVNVGLLADPVEHQGLAHLLEHLLYTSPTKKFPDEGSFLDFFYKHGYGFTSASTGEGYTACYFQVNSEAFEQTLNRFAQLIAEPLFKREIIEREIESIQAEFELSLADEWERSMRILQMTHNKSSHSFAKLPTGNKQTLKMDDDRLFKAVCKFYHKWYSANLMTLVVLDKEPLDKLESVVVGLFGQIANHNRKPFRIKPILYPSKYCRREAKVVPLKDDTSKLLVFFTIPDKPYLHDAIYFLFFLLGNSTGNGNFDPGIQAHSGFDFAFILSNVNNKQERIDTVKLIFQYFEMIKSTSPDQLERAYCEMRTMIQTRFDYATNNNNFIYFTNLCLKLQKYPFEEFLTRTDLTIPNSLALLGEFNYRKFMKVFKYLSVDCINLHFTSASVKNEPVELQTELHYGIEYAVVDIDSSVLDQWTNCGRNDKLTLPSASPFVPSDFKLKPRLEHPPLEYPTQLELNNPRLLVWHLHDSIFRVPQAFVSFRIACPFIHANGQNYSFAKQFVDNFLFVFYPKFLYQTKVAKIKYSIQVASSALEITFKGFNDKLDTFIYALFEQLVNHNMSPSCFENTSYEVDETSDDDLGKKCQKEIFKPQYIVTSELNQKSSEAISDFKLQLFANCQVRVFVHGNMTKEESIHLSKKVFGMLTKLITITPENVPNKVNQVPRMINFIQLKHGITRFVCTDSKSNINCLSLLFKMDYLIHCTSMSDYLRMISCSEWFIGFLEPLYRAQLRYNENLTYLIQVRNFEMFVQSSYSVLYLWSRTEAFIESIENILVDLSDKDVTKLKNRVIDYYAKSSAGLFNKSVRLWDEIHGDTTSQKISSMESITKDDLINFYRDYIRMDGPKSRRLVTMVKGGKCEHKIGKESMANLDLHTGKTFTNIEQLRRERTEFVPLTSDYHT